MKSNLPTLIREVDNAIARLQAHRQWLLALQDTWRPFADKYPKLVPFADSPEGVLVRDCRPKIRQIVADIGFRPEKEEEVDAEV
jgi:hypothetical protein